MLSATTAVIQMSFSQLREEPQSSQKDPKGAGVQRYWTLKMFSVRQPKSHNAKFDMKDYLNLGLKTAAVIVGLFLAF